MLAWDEKGAYLVLLAEAWLERCLIDAQPELIQRLICVDDDAWPRIKKHVVDRFFVPTDDGKHLYNPQQMDIYNEVYDQHLQRVEAGRKGGLKRGLSGAPAGLKPGRSNQSQSQSQKNNRAQRFGEFWDAYPKKRDKKKTRDKWKARGLDSMADQLIADVKNRLANDRQWREGYIPNPTTYINGERWEDEIDTTPAKEHAPAADPERNRANVWDGKSPLP